MSKRVVVLTDEEIDKLLALIEFSADEDALDDDERSAVDKLKEARLKP